MDRVSNTLASVSKALGGVIGLVLFTTGDSSGRKGRWLIAACGGLGVTLAAFAVLPAFPIAIVAIVVVGGSAAIVDTLAQTLLQDAGSAQRRGAAMGVWLFSVGLGPIGFLAIGALAGVVGAPAAQLASGAALVGIVVGIGSSAVIRRLP